MKLGKELCAKVCEIPPLYADTLNEVYDHLINEKLAQVSRCEPDELPGLQKKIQALEECKKIIPNAHEEATLYKT